MVLRGFKRQARWHFPATLTTVLAGSGTGKTTFCKEVIYSLLMQGKRVGMVCLEESNRRTLLGR